MRQAHGAVGAEYLKFKVVIVYYASADLELICQPVAQTAAEAAHGRLEDFAPDPSDPSSDPEPEHPPVRPAATTKHRNQGDSD